MSRQGKLPLDVPPENEPKLGAMVTSQRTGSKPEPAPSAAAPSPHAAEIATLLQQIFERTGLKVTPEDPIVAAALIHSSLLESASNKAQLALSTAAETAATQLTEAISNGVRHIEELDRAMNRVLQQLAEGTRQVGEQEMLELRARFARAAAETLDHIRRNILRRSGWRHWWRDPAGCCVGLAFGLALGAFCALYWSRAPDAEQLRLLHNGRLLDAAWASLSPQQRVLINAADPTASARVVEPAESSSPSAKPHANRNDRN